MHHDADGQLLPALKLAKNLKLDEFESSIGAAALEVEQETPAQIMFNVGLPAWLGATAGLVGAGAALAPALGVGFLSGLTFYLVRTWSQT